MRLREWLARPVRRWATWCFVLLACALPLYLLHDPLDVVWLISPTMPLRGDDFPYFANSRTFGRMLDHLWEPHNSHVVPVFRLWSWLVFQTAGRWEYVPSVSAMATYAVLAVVLLLSWHLLRRETGHEAVALGAMIGLGMSIVTQPAVTSFAASQTLWAGLGVLGALSALQSWRQSGGWVKSGLAVAASCVAAGSWSGGFIVGPTVAVYLWSDARPRCRKAATVALTATVLAVLLLAAWKGSQLVAKEKLGDRPASDAIRPLAGIVHTVHAIPEFLVLRNLGVDAPLSTGQGTVFLLAVILAWMRTRRGVGLIRPLEGAGAVMVIGSFLLVYTVRGYLPFDSLRELRWYCTLPQIGTVLFASAWLAHLRSGPSPDCALTRGGFVGVLAFMAGMAVLHGSASENLFVAAAPRMAPSERRIFLTPELRLARARGLSSERNDHQGRFLARLDQIEAIGKQAGIGQRDLIRVFGKLRGPGVPEMINAFDMLDLPPGGSTKDPAFIRSVMGKYMIDEPLPRPPWLDPSDPWPPP